MDVRFMVAGKHIETGWESKLCIVKDEDLANEICDKAQKAMKEGRKYFVEYSEFFIEKFENDGFYDEDEGCSLIALL